MLNLVGEPIIMEGVSRILLNAENKDLREVLKAFIYDRIELLESVLPMIKIIIPEALYHEDIREALFQNTIAKAFEIFTIFHRQMLERGLIRENINALAMGRSMIGNVLMLIFYRHFFAEKINELDMDNELDAVIDIIMYGIAQTELKTKD